MNKKYKINQFDPVTGEEETLYKLFFCLDNLFLEKEIDEPKPSNDFRMKNFRTRSQLSDESWWLVWLEEQIVGYGVLNIRNKKSPTFEDSKHVASIHMRIEKNHRRKGIGLELMKLIIAKSKEYDFVTTLQSSTKYKSGFNFCEKLKGVLAMEGAENRLRFNEVDWDLMNEWRKQGHIKGEKEGRTLQWFDTCPEDIVEEYCKVYTETMNQQPFGELEHKPVITPDSRREQEKQYAKTNCNWHTVITCENDGTISGLTDFTYFSGMPYRIYQELTGVLKQYRGNGLGKWLKAEMLHFMHRTYPEAKYVRTGNANANAPMLSINTRMGFKLHEVEKVYKFKVVNLEKRIAEIESK
ncbi:MAG: GNAT family N-acetyltransferase [Asgard group archaeon]|nr:GNAT family N-acetyltransferase [Asgard group archaeon]